MTSVCKMNGLNKIIGQSQTELFAASYETVVSTADWLKERTNYRPKIGIICGSGLGGLATLLTDVIDFSYRDIPNFPVSTVHGHAGKFMFGILSGKEVVCMNGRVHAYEGHPMHKIALPIRVMKNLGVETLFITNASGGLNPDYNVGDLMIIKDHVNLPGLCGYNPLIGANDSRFGARFPAMSEAYSRQLRQLAKSIAAKLEYDFVREGVYSYQMGPCFETVGECRLLRLLGADVTGMSTVPEVIVARHCGIHCLGLSLVTNQCVDEYDCQSFANHEEVLETARVRSNDIQNFVCSLVEHLDQQLLPDD